MAKKKSSQPISPFYRAIFHVNKTAMGYRELDDDWGIAAGFVLARHRCKQEHTPYCVANEFICAKLGSVIGLPIPPFSLTKISDHGKRLLFSTLDFNPDGISPPPVEPDLCMKYLPQESVGVIVFDIWIANEDRHNENLVVDNVSKPKKMRVFDHDQALFGGSRETGVPRLLKLRNRLGITGSSVTGGNEHCLLPFLESADHLDFWIDRIRSIPTWYVQDAVNAVRKIYLKNSEADAAIDFLTHRQQIIGSLAGRQLCELRGIVVPPKETQMELDLGGEL